MGGIFALAFYAYGATLLVRWPALARFRAVDTAGAAWITVGWLVLYAAAVLLPRAAGTPGRRAWRAFDRRFRTNAAATVGLALLLVVACAALLAPLVVSTGPVEHANPAATRFQAPSTDHPLGTDKFGRDVWSRVVYGARTSLGIAVTAALLAALFGTLYGAASGFAGRRVDDAMMRLVDGLLAFPRLVLVLTLVALFPNSLGLLIVVIASTGWMGVARIVRGETRRLRERDFVQAAVASGLGPGRLALFHVLPNALGPVIVSATLNVGAVILLEAYLSFLGLGVQPPAPSWGAMVFDGRDVLVDAWWVAAGPAAAITLTVVAVNLIGDGLRDALEARTG